MHPVIWGQLLGRKQPALADRSGQILEQIEGQAEGREQGPVSEDEGLLWTQVGYVFQPRGELVVPVGAQLLFGPQPLRHKFHPFVRAQQVHHRALALDSVASPFQSFFPHIDQRRSLRRDLEDVQSTGCENEELLTFLVKEGPDGLLVRHRVH